MRVRFKKWGNSAGLKLPAPVPAAAALGVGQTVEIRAEGGLGNVEPVEAQVYDLDHLLDRMARESFPENVDSEPPVGRESW
jgi:antitoxin MazE